MKTILCSTLLYVALLGISPAFAETPDAKQDKAALTRQIKALEARLAVLEARDEKETAASASKAPQSHAATPASPIVDTTFFQPKVAEGEWTIDGNWKQLDKGMSKSAVSQLLGEPTRKINSFMKSTARVWIYKGVNLATKATVEGKVRFDKRGKVIGYSVPKFKS